LELAPHDAELIRRGYAEFYFQKYGLQINETPVEGVLLRPNDFKNLLPIFHAKIAESVAKRYTEDDLKGFKTLARNLEQLAKLNQNTGAIFVFEEALPKEKFHQEDFLAGNTDEAGAQNVTASPLWKAAHASGSLFAREYGRSPEADRISEFVAKLATNQESKYGWDKLENFAAERDKALKDWAQGVVRKNSAEIEANGIEAFRKKFERISKYADFTQINGRGIAETNREGSSLEDNRTGSRRDENRTDQTSGGEPAAGRSQADESLSHRTEETESVNEDSPETAKRKKAAFSRILGEEVFYDPQTHAETERRASELENLKGVNQAVSDALYSDKPSAESMRVIYRELTRLNDLADEHLAAARTAEYEAVAGEIARLTNQIVQRQVALGQATEIAKTLAPLSPEHSLTVAARLKQKALSDDAATLTTEETTAVKNAANDNTVSTKELARAENKIERLKQKIKELRAGTRILKERKVGDPKARILSQVEKKISADLTEGFNKHAADLKSLFDVAAMMKSISSASEKLLAPNGKPSNLTPFQHAQVRTENFEKYAGDWEAVAKKKALYAMRAVQINIPTIGGFTSKRDRKNQALSLFSPLQNKTVTTVDGREAVFTVSGLDETLQHSADLRVLQVIPQLPELIKNSIHLWSEPYTKTNKPNILAFHNYAVKTNFNGVEAFTRITLREDTDKHIYYDNHSVEVGRIEKALSDIQPDRKTNTGEEAEGLSKDRLFQWLTNVNENDVTKVVDENGEPLVVRHGTGVDVESFDTDFNSDFTNSLIKTGAYFTDSTEEASEYAEAGDQPNIVPAFLSIKNPLIQNLDFPFRVSSREIKSAIRQGYDGIIQKMPKKTHYVNAAR
jgi:hypothetical protein